jgi:hypothetical protein
MECNKYKKVEDIINRKYEKTESTMVIRAAFSGCLELLKMLINEFEARLSIVNKNEENCLIAATRAKKNEIV